MINRHDEPDATRHEDPSNPAGVFNLLDEAWIPVLRANGRFERLGIRRCKSKVHHHYAAAWRSRPSNSTMMEPVDERYAPPQEWGSRLHL
ncbi:MAG: hypothetical protein KF841_08530 [Phycisphaerae bacterium]|nr:hypothetical protein [Phycisphaerae bacterium]